MKKIINKIILSLFAIATLMSCDSNPDNTIYDVFDGLTNGAALRTLAVTSPTFDIVNLSSFFEVEIEEQDKEGGGLLSNVEVFVGFGGNEALVTTIPASEFVTTANNLPGTTVRIVLQDALNALGLTPDGVACGDTMGIRLNVNLTDGRSFTNTDASGSLQGSYFSSPYFYSATIVANLPSDTVYTGQYMLEIVDRGDIFGATDYAEGTYTIEATGGAQRIIRGVPTLPEFGFGPQDITLDFVCGEIILSGPLGAACDEGIFSGSANVNSTYDLNNPDDTSFVVTYTSDITNDCGSKSQASFRLTKI
jgi:hypothetical protein